MLGLSIREVSERDRPKGEGHRSRLEPGVSSQAVILYQKAGSVNRKRDESQGIGQGAELRICGGLKSKKC